MNGLCDLCTPGTVRNSEDSLRFIHWWPSVVYCAMKDLMSTPVKTDHNLDFVDLTQDEQAPISASHRFHNFPNSTVSKQAVVVNVAAENRNANIMWGCAVTMLLDLKQLHSLNFFYPFHVEWRFGVQSKCPISTQHNKRPSEISF